jgi:hypothetical protein
MPIILCDESPKSLMYRPAHRNVWLKWKPAMASYFQDVFGPIELESAGHLRCQAF